MTWEIAAVTVVITSSALDLSLGHYDVLPAQLERGRFHQSTRDLASRRCGKVFDRLTDELGQKDGRDMRHGVGGCGGRSHRAKSCSKKASC